MILLTGAGGFIGKSLLRRLKISGQKVIPLYHSNAVDLQEDRWSLDLTEPAHLAAARTVSASIKTVIHLAGCVDIALNANPDNALSAPIPGNQNIYKIYSSNVIATTNLLDFCLKAKVEHIIFASSQAVYGMPQAPILTEQTSCAPLEHYATSKLCCERLLAVGATPEMAVTIFRIPGVFSDTRSNGIVYQYCRSAVRTKNICVTANFPLPLDIIHLEDLMAAFVAALKQNKKQFQCLNIATGEPCSLDLLADDIAKLVPNCHVEHGIIPQPVVHLDERQAFKALGWRSKSRRERLSSVIERIQHAI